MSQKRSKRTRQLWKEPSPKERLKNQKTYIRNAALDYLGGSAFGFVLALICLVVACTMEDRAQAMGVFLAMWALILILVIPFGVLSVKRFLVFRTVRPIQDTTEEVVAITCTRLRYITHPTGRRYDSPFFVLGLMFTDDKGRDYVYLVPRQRGFASDSNIQRRLRAAYVGQALTLRCYRGTSVVKSFEGGLENLDTYERI